MSGDISHVAANLRSLCAKHGTCLADAVHSQFLQGKWHDSGGLMNAKSLWSCLMKNRRLAYSDSEQRTSGNQPKKNCMLLHTEAQQREKLNVLYGRSMEVWNGVARTIASKVRTLQLLSVPWAVGSTRTVSHTCGTHCYSTALRFRTW